MSNRETDILQIRKYLNGELDAKAMHQLERKAQNDPFLMDALEGYEKTGGDQQPQLNDLAGRLNRRIGQKKEARIIPWRLISIAASVLIVCSIGVWWLYSGNTSNPTKLAQAVKPDVKTEPARPADTIIPPAKEPVAALAKTSYPAVQVQKVVRAPSAKAAPPAPVASDNIANVTIKDSVPKAATPLNERIVMGYTGKRKKDTTGSVANLKRVAVNSLEQQLPGQAPGAADNNSPNADQAKEMLVQGKPITPKSLKEISMTDKNYASSTKMITGKVVAKDDGLPIPGASVHIKGTNTSAVTDVNGRFALPGNNGSNLVIDFIGYQRQEVATGAPDSVKTISLQPNNSSLAEVVVTGYKPKSRGEENAAISAHPNTGWSSFRKYLKENAHSPDGKRGGVKLSFIVNINGTVSDIKIEKGLSDATNQAAIDLVNNGPDWVGNTDGKPEKVTLRVKFVK